MLLHLFFLSYLLIHAFTQVLTRAFTHSFAHRLILLLTYPFMHSLTHASANMLLFMHSFIHSLVSAVVHSLAHPFTHSFVILLSFLTHSCFLWLIHTFFPHQFTVLWSFRNRFLIHIPNNHAAVHEKTKQVKVVGSRLHKNLSCDSGFRHKIFRRT